MGCLPQVREYLDALSLQVLDAAVTAGCPRLWEWQPLWARQLAVDRVKTMGPKLVAAVDAGTPAQQSGVAPGWRMRTLAGESVDSRAKLEERLLAARDAGEILVACEFADDDGDCAACGLDCSALAA